MAREVTQSQLLRRGIVALVAILVAVTFVMLRTNNTFGTEPHVVAHVDTAGGALRPGADVKIDGVIVGRVHEIENAEEGGVDIDIMMTTDDMDRIPENVVARILPATVFGTTFVDLVVHGEPQGQLRAGAAIAPDETQGTLELQQALDDIDRLVEAVGPAELASAIGSAAEALDGRGEQISRTITTVNNYLQRLNPRMPQVRSDFEKLAANMEIADQIAPDLLDAADDALVFLDVLVDQEAQLTNLIAGATSLAITSRDFLQANKDELVAFINNTGILIDALYDNRQVGITDAITQNIRLGEVLPSVVENGWVKVEGTMTLNFSGNPSYYGSGQRPSYRQASIGALGGGQ